MVFWKAPDFSAGAVKPVNMIDEERDTCPALLALYYPFVWDAHFPGFQSEKYTYRFLGFCVVLTALSRLRWCTQQPISRGSLGVQWLMFSCFIHALTRSLAAFSRLHQDGDFSLFALCSLSFFRALQISQFFLVRSCFNPLFLVSENSTAPITFGNYSNYTQPYI